jgi:hypothetical protein
VSIACRRSVTRLRSSRAANTGESRSAWRLAVVDAAPIGRRPDGGQPHGWSLIWILLNVTVAGKAFAENWAALSVCSGASETPPAAGDVSDTASGRTFLCIIGGIPRMRFKTFMTRSRRMARAVTLEYVAVGRR